MHVSIDNQATSPGKELVKCWTHYCLVITLGL